MSLETEIVQVNSEDLDKIFEPLPKTTASVEDLAVGKEAVTTEAKTKEVELDNKEVSVEITSKDSNTPFYEDEDEDDNTEAKTKEKGAKEPVATAKEDEGDSEEAAKDDDTDEQIADTKQVDEVLTSTVDYLIKSGKWIDFEGREDLEINEEVYADLVAKQDEYRLTQLFNELLDSTGEYGKAITSHVKNGGNPDDIIDLFKEQKQLQQIEPSTEVGKQQVIEKYYSEILGWKPEKVERTVKRLITDDEIETEFKDVKELYDKHYTEQLRKTEDAVKQQEEANKRQQDTFVNNIKTVLKEDATLTQADKVLIQNSVFNFNHKLPNGQKVNEIYLKFAEIQSDPKQYVEFVRFVMDKDNYKKSIKRAEKTAANKNAFSFIKGGAALGKIKTQPVTIQENAAKAPRGTDFSFAIKK